jgi:cell division transport system ATP-binding protein
MIEFSHIYKTYPGPVHALRDVSFKIDKGEFVFLTGPSGAGKTTLFKMLSAFDRPTSGSLRVMGTNVPALASKEVPFYRRKIGVVYQDFKLLLDRSVEENIRLTLDCLDYKRGDLNRRVEEVMSQVGLLSKRAAYPSQLSGGEQQRVALARAIVHEPSLLVADEPTGNLDPELSSRIMDLIEEVNSRGTTVVVATHDHNLVEKRGKRRLHLQAGEMGQWGECHV